jgi:uncharacterized protein
MKRVILGIVLLLSLLILATAGAVFAQAFPDPQGYVSDFAGLLSAEGKAQLEDQLSRLEKDTTAEVAVVTIKSLEGDTIEDYASRLFEKWGIGKKGQDNGVLFIVAQEDRKLRIEVGYGLEAVLTDSRAGRIRDNDILPYFKKGDYEKGIIAGVNAIETYVRGGTPPQPLEENPVSDTLGWAVPIFIFATVIGSYLSGFMARSKSIWLGAIFGGVVGIVLGLAIGGIAVLIICTILSAGFGTGLDFILSRNYRNRKSTGSPTSWHSTWGGFHGGSGSSGGFGGFGGGMSGGGGASGGW